MADRKKKKNKALSLVVLLILLCALIAVYMLVRSLTAEDEAPGGEEETTIALTDYTSADITALNYTFDETTVSLYLDGTTWKVKDDEKFPLDQTLIANMTNAVGELSAARSIDSGELSDYGLDDPDITVTVTLADGTEKLYEIGDTNSFNDNTYLSTDGKIYMFSDTLSPLFDAKLEDLILIEDSFPDDITSDSIVSLTVKNDSGDEYTYDSECEDMDTFINDIKKAFTFKNWAGYGLTADELTDYGISDNGKSIVIKYNKDTSTDTSAENNTTVEATWTVYCGEAEDGNCYYALKGGSMTYSIEKENLDDIIEYLLYDYPAKESAETETASES